MPSILSASSAWSSLLIAVGVWSTSVVALPAQSPAVEASIQGPTTRDWSGGPVAFPLRVRNVSDRPVEIQVRLELPDSWKRLDSGEPLRLDPGGAAVRLLALGIPASAVAGSHGVGWSLDVSGEAVDGGSVEVSVPPRPALSLQAEQPPEFVVAGTRRTLGFVLRNDGNMPLDVGLETRWTGDEAVVAEPNRVRIGPDEAVPVHVRIRARPEAAENGSRREVLEVRARVAEMDLEAPWASVPLEVVQSAEAPGTAARHSFPVRMTMGSAATGAFDGRGELWGEVSGSGPLRAGGDTRLNFSFRGPEPQAAGLTRRDRYHVAIHGDHFRLAAGDQFLRRTMLTEPGREAFGGSGEVVLGPLRAGGFHGQNRRGGIDFETLGGYVGLRVGDAVTATVNRVQRTGPDSTDLWSVGARLHPSPLLDLSGETGWTASGPGRDRARRIDARGVWRSLRYAVSHLQVDSVYPGPYQGREENLGQLSLRLPRDLRIEGTVRRDVRHRSYRSVLPGGRSVTTRMTAGIGLGRAFNFEVRQGREELRQGSRTKRVRSLSGRLRVALSAGPLRISPVVDYGRVRGDGLAAPVPVLDAGVEIATAGQESSVSASVAYESGATLAGYRGPERWVGRLGGQLALGGSVRIHGQVHGYHMPGPRRRTHGLLDAGAAVTLPNGHELNLKSRTTITAGRPDLERTNLSMGYSIPVSVPLGRAGTVGRVVGRVVDGVGGESADSVLVRMGGAAALTDAEGRFVFPDVEPGRHRLRLDFSTLPSDRIVLGGGSRTVIVEGGSDGRTEFVLRPGGTIRGTLTRYERALTPRALASTGDGDGGGRTDLRPVGPVVRALVILEGPDGARRRLTGEDGDFSASGLAPGTWRVRVAPGGLPPGHSVSPDPAVVELDPAGALSLDLAVIPASREVRFAGGGVVTLDSSTAPDPEPVEAGPAGADKTGQRGSLIRETSLRGTTAGRTGLGAEPPLWHVVRPLDFSLMQLARQAYDDVFLWPKIWAANQDTVSDPYRLKTGQRLRIPGKTPLSVDERQLLDSYQEEP